MTVATYRPIHLFDPRFQFAAQREVEQQLSPRNKEQTWSPAVDIYEFDDRFEIRADIPGITLTDVEITIEKNVLTINGERPAPAAEDGQAHRIERDYGKFSRQFRLPETVDVESVKASGDNGVLQVVVPKAEKLQPRRIEVQTS